MLGQVVDTVVRFFSKLHCNIKCCSNTVRVSSPVRGVASRGCRPLRFRPSQDYLL